ncbi:hypothetical protein MAXJ12_24067 [Mesorhizobium alhagi CCNWXJ12-2]|uniref:Uncharacterized protein n=1 Tax=Mesorhizobium alhagi CCNWXJ12-2 TaxID=1107882 RepID=H0HX94_9HYPH|nr:hypothetical protein MAXJ12_24067 [Mesorhizobium alhagi CCNWXJ12-2]
MEMLGMIDSLYLTTIFAIVAFCCLAIVIAVLQEPDRAAEKLRSLWRGLKKETN